MDILLVTQEPPGPQSFHHLLQTHPAVNFLSCLANCDEALAQLTANNGHNLGIDLALFDLDCKQCDALAILTHLAAKDVDTKIGFIGRDIPLNTISQLVKRGVDCVLPKSADTDQVEQALNSLQWAEQYLPAEFQRALFGAERPDVILRLSQTQLAVLDLLREGVTNANIAKRLRLPEQTVSSYVRTIFTALQVSADPECVAGARDLGLTA